jgi:hypothetical protein
MNKKRVFAAVILAVYAAALLSFLYLSLHSRDVHVKVAVNVASSAEGLEARINVSAPEEATVEAVVVNCAGRSLAFGPFTGDYSGRFPLSEDPSALVAGCWALINVEGVGCRRIEAQVNPGNTASFTIDYCVRNVEGHALFALTPLQAFSLYAVYGLPAAAASLLLFKKEALNRRK